MMGKLPILHAAASDPNGFDGAVISHHDGWKDLFPMGFRLGGSLGYSGGGSKIEHHQIRLHPLRKITDFIALMHHLGGSDCCEP